MTMSRLNTINIVYYLFYRCRMYQTTKSDVAKYRMDACKTRSRGVII
jgi:hypothetical protein